MRARTWSLRRSGVVFEGPPGFIDPSAVFDTSRKIVLGSGTVVARDTYLLTHDYSITPAADYVGQLGEMDLNITGEIHIGKNCFLGLRSIVLPGSEIGDGVIVGAASVVRGKIPSGVVVFGNPATVYERTESWVMRKLTSPSSHQHLSQCKPKTTRTRFLRGSREMI
jgi:acetyltransferase-like isoleucine patch superfamily enzyme